VVGAIKEPTGGLGKDENGWQRSHKTAFRDRKTYAGNFHFRAARPMAGIYGNDACEVHCLPLLGPRGGEETAKAKKADTQPKTANKTHFTSGRSSAPKPVMQQKFW